MSENAPVRWTQATVYADMWVDPDQDPRGNVAPDGELPTLLYYLGHYRLTLGMKCEGLDADQLAALRDHNEGAYVSAWSDTWPAGSSPGAPGSSVASPCSRCLPVTARIPSSTARSPTARS